MPEFFIHANSFAAPFFSDETTTFVEAATAEDALTQFAGDYKHPAGLYAADAYASSDAFHKGKKALARWLCNKAAVQEEIQRTGSHSYYSGGPDHLEVDGERVEIEDPKGGRIVRV